MAVATHALCSWRCTGLGENRRLVADEPAVEFEKSPVEVHRDVRRITSLIILEESIEYASNE